MTRAYH